jgi:signal transduction histidine kinase/DNA-binding NarL/FixJ family response regulator
MTMIFPFHPPMAASLNANIPPPLLLHPSQILNHGYEEFLKEETSLVLVAVYLLVFNTAIIIRCFVSYSLITSLSILLTIPGYLYLYAVLHHHYPTSLYPLPIKTIYLGNIVVVLCAFITGFIVYSTSLSNTCSGFACDPPNTSALQPNFYALAISNTVFTPVAIKSHSSTATILSLIVKVLLLLASSVHLQSRPGTFITICGISFFQGLFLFYYESYTKRMYLNKIQIEHQVRATIAIENEKLVMEMQTKELKSLIGNVAHDLKSPLQAFTFELDTLLSRFHGGGGGGSGATGETNATGPGENVASAVATAASAAAAASAVTQSQSHGTGDRDRERGRAGRHGGGGRGGSGDGGCIESVLLLKSISNFMVMLINRAIDYTKATSGIGLKPSFETLHVTETMEWVVRCAERCNRLIPICIIPTPLCICRYIISDRQWLLENLLCLVSNAQKFTSKGDITIRCLLIAPTTLPPPPRAPALAPLLTSGSAASPCAPFATAGVRSDAIGPVATGGHVPIENESIQILAVSTHEVILPVATTSPAAPASSTVPSSIGADATTASTAGGSGAVNSSLPYLRFEVEDSGIGIPDDKKKELFRPFKQAQRRAGGTGLGLYSLAKRVESLGGSCGISNRHDGKQGARFWFTIPYRPDELVESQYNGNSSLSYSYSQASNRVIPIGDDDHDFFSRSVSAVDSGTGVGRNTGFGDDCGEGGGEGECYSHSGACSCSCLYERRITRSSFQDLQIAEIEMSTEGTGEAPRLGTPSPPLPQETTNHHQHRPSSSPPATTATVLKNHPSPALTKDNDKHNRRPVATVSQGKQRILLVEDSTLIQKTTMRALAREGYLVDLATNGLECLEMAERAEYQYDIVLMDIQMPLMDGFEATIRLREIEKERKMSSEKGRGMGTSVSTRVVASATQTTMNSRFHDTDGSVAGGVREGAEEGDIETGSLSQDHPVSSAAHVAASLLRRHHLIVIGLSANADSETKEMAIAAGMDEFIPKPLSMDALKLCLKKLHASVVT